MLPNTASYAALAALWRVRLGGTAVGLRRSRRTSRGDGGRPALTRARAAARHSTETLPNGPIPLALSLGTPAFFLALGPIAHADAIG